MCGMILRFLEEKPSLCDTGQNYTERPLNLNPKKKIILCVWALVIIDKRSEETAS